MYQILLVFLSLIDFNQCYINNIKIRTYHHITNYIEYITSSNTRIYHNKENEKNNFDTTFQINNSSIFPMTYYPFESSLETITNNYTTNMLSTTTSSIDLLSSSFNLDLSNTNNIKTTTQLFDMKETLAIFYLEQELKLPEEVLRKIILKYSWILYLKVNTNLKPTINVLKSYSFTNKDIRAIISKTPSILAINHEWTLPEKLLSLQKMFYLTRNQLTKVIVQQPYLLTSSIDRNMKIASFLSNDMLFTEEDIRFLLLKDPRIGIIIV